MEWSFLTILIIVIVSTVEKITITPIILTSILYADAKECINSHFKLHFSNKL